MAKSLFSVPIFFIVFRETIEAAIIVSTLLGLAHQIVYDDQSAKSTPTTSGIGTVVNEPESATEDDPRRRLARKLKIQVRWLFFAIFSRNFILLQIFVGSTAGFVVALAIGAAYVVYGDCFN